MPFRIEVTMSNGMNWDNFCLSAQEFIKETRLVSEISAEEKKYTDQATMEWNILQLFIWKITKNSFSHYISYPWQ